MSANVWFEEVNTGLLQELKDTIRIKNAKGELTTLSDKAFIVRKPEEDFKFEVFPCVSIYNKDYKFEPRRYDPQLVKVGEDIENHLAIMEEPHVPYDLTYQIDFWSRFQSDMDCMTMTWLTKHFHQFNLSVIDDGGIERTCNCLTQGSIVKSDLVENKERLFHSIVNLKIWVEIDSETRYNKPMVVIRDIDASEKDQGGAEE